MSAERVATNGPYLLRTNEHPSERDLYDRERPPYREEYRKIDWGNISMLSKMIVSNHGALIVMRHGIQLVEDERKDLVDPTRKIRLMQLPFNLQDPTAQQSLAEADTFGHIIHNIAQKNHLPISILSSRNKRAAEIGAVLSVSNSTHIDFDDRLTCVNYRTDIPPEEINALLGEENKGALTWREEVVDAVCGEGTFQRISTDMEDLVGEYNHPGSITLCITHTPQTNAVDVITQDQPVRMPELGFRVITGGRSMRFSQNIFQAA